MRVGIAGLLHESNTFLPAPTMYEDFASTSFNKGAELLEKWQAAQRAAVETPSFKLQVLRAQKAMPPVGV